MEQQDKNYNFHEPGNTTCFVCSHVNEKNIFPKTYFLTDFPAKKCKLFTGR